MKRRKNRRLGSLIKKREKAEEEEPEWEKQPEQMGDNKKWDNEKVNKAAGEDACYNWWRYEDRKSKREAREQ